MHRQTRRRGRRIRDFKARTEFSVSFCSQRAYLWCRDGKGPQRSYSSQIISFSMLQSLLKFTHVSYACTPLIILAAGDKGKLGSPSALRSCPLCLTVVSLSRQSASTFLLIKMDRGTSAFLMVFQRDRTSSPAGGDTQTSVSRCTGSPLGPVLCLQCNLMKCWRTEGSFLWS